MIGSCPSDSDARVTATLNLKYCLPTQVTVDDNLKWGFALYSSPGNFDAECEDPVLMERVRSLLHTLARCVVEILFSRSQVEQNIKIFRAHAFIR